MSVSASAVRNGAITPSERRRRDYEAYISSPAWASKRQALWALQGRACARCKSTNELHVHHHTYNRFGDEDLSDLVGLCKKCHMLVHSFQRRHRREFSLTRATFHVISCSDEALKRPVKRNATTRKRTRTASVPAPPPRKLTATEKRDRDRARRTALTTPNERGFVPRHLRGARDVDGRLVAGPASGYDRTTWRR